jgi:hypothetical protein
MTDDFFNGSDTRAAADIPAFFDSGVPKLIAELVAMGVLVSIGTTRDRGAITITVTNDGRWRRDYFRDSTDAADWLGLAIAAVSGRGIGTTATDRPVSQKPTTGRRRAS